MPTEGHFCWASTTTALLPEAHRLAASQIKKSEKLHDLFFREMPEYPEFAWQEAIINAVAHRDYNEQGREIEVWFFDDRMEVLSPGDLVPPVTLEQLRERRPSHASRNPLIVRLLASVGIMRDEGEGVPRIFEEMEESLLKQPGLAVEAAQFCVTLRNEPIFAGPPTEWQAVVSQLPLTTSQKRVLLAHPGGFSNEDYRTLNNVDRDQAYKELQEMVAASVCFLKSSCVKTYVPSERISIDGEPRNALRQSTLRAITVPGGGGVFSR